MNSMKRKNKIKLRIFSLQQQSVFELFSNLYLKTYEIELFTK